MGSAQLLEQPLLEICDEESLTLLLDLVPLGLQSCAQPRDAARIFWVQLAARLERAPVGVFRSAR